jgi:phosphatidylinositol alpha-1,6-mannosyltransferase
VKTLLITPDFPPRHGGIQILLHRVVEQFSRIEPQVLTLDQPEADSFDEQLAFRVDRTAPRLLPHRARVAWLNADAVPVGLAARPDVIFCGHMVCAPAAMLLSRLLRVPYALYLYANELAGNTGLSRLAAPRARAVIAISEHTWKLGLDIGARESTLHLIPPGVDSPPPVNASKASRPTVITVARMDERYKGHDVMLRALPLVRAQVPDVEYVLVGDGPLRPVHEDHARRLGIRDSVRFVGRIDDAERNRLLASSHVFAMPSRLRPGGTGGEGFGIVYLEANAFGLPAVGANVGGARDAIVDGETGVLVDPEDHLAVARVLVDLLQNPERAAALGEAGRKRIPDFAYPKISAAVEDLLIEVALKR